MGQTNVELPIDRHKCAIWNVSVADVHNVIQTAIGGKAVSQMIEGEKSFDITVRWPLRLREDENDILDIPVDVIGNVVRTQSADPDASGHPASTGYGSLLPSFTGSARSGKPLETTTAPRERLRDLVTPLSVDSDFALDPHGKFIRGGASVISREEGKRLIAVKFSVRNRDLASAVKEAQRGPNS